MEEKHGINSNKIRYTEPLIHVLVWMILFGVPFLLESNRESADWKNMLAQCVMPLVFCFVFYINYFILIPRLFFCGRQRIWLLVNIVVILSSSIALRLWQWHCFLPVPSDCPVPVPGFGPWNGLRPGMEILFCLRDMLTLVLITGVALLIKLGGRWFKDEEARKEAERMRVEAELMNLRNQLNPHFLLNTLNSIYALIVFDREKAGTAVLELSQLLRYVLYETRQNTVPLYKEIDFIMNYIALMKMRFSGNVEVDTQISVPENSATEIAPLMFMSLIENAFKHGINPAGHSIVRISVIETPERIQCRIANGYHPKGSSDRSGSGIGLEQLGRRLEILYHGKYEWVYGPDPERKWYISDLSIMKIRKC